MLKDICVILTLDLPPLVNGREISPFPDGSVFAKITEFTVWSDIIVVRWLEYSILEWTLISVGLKIMCLTGKMAKVFDSQITL